MKHIVICLALAFLVFASPVYAFDPPDQGTDNATDVILWHGDNATSTIEITGLTESNEGIANDFLAFAIVAFLIVMILSKGGVILTALGVPTAFVYGFITASEQDVYSPLWVAGVAVGLLGVYFLYEIAAPLIIKAARRK